MTAAHCREMRRSESWMWLPVSAPRPISSGDCAMRTKRREPSGEITSSAASARAEIWASGIGSLDTGIVAPCEKSRAAGELYFAPRERSPPSPRSGRSGEAAGDVVGHVGGEGFFELLRDRAGRGRKLVAGNFTGAEQIAIRRGNENFVGGEEILGPQRLLP